MAIFVLISCHGVKDRLTARPSVRPSVRLADICRRRGWIKLQRMVWSLYFLASQLQRIQQRRIAIKENCLRRRRRQAIHRRATERNGA